MSHTPIMQRDTRRRLPRRESILHVLSRYVIQHNRDAPDMHTLMNDPGKLHKMVTSTRVNWKEVGDALDCSREYVYHWYWETFLRHANHEHQITKAQKALIRDEILRELRSGDYKLPNMQNRVREKVFGPNSAVNRSEFNIAYNNIKRSAAVKSALAELGVSLGGKESLSPSSMLGITLIDGLGSPSSPFQDLCPAPQTTSEAVDLPGARPPDGMHELFRLFDGQGK